MRRDEMEKSKKRSRETYYERREIDKNRKTFSESSQYYRSVVKKGHCKEIVEEQNYRKEKFKHPSDHSFKKQEMSKRHASPETNRRERVHRNSPIELVVSGCRNTDSSSSSQESSDENIRHKHKRHKHKKRHESFEELSRRKQRIESELNALDAEEAAQRKEEPRMKRNHSHDRHKRMETSKRIKQEPMSDDENDRLRRGNHRSSDRSGHRRRNGDNKSRSTADNVEWGDADSSRSKIPDKEKEKPNFSASGKLTEDTNTYNGVVIKYNEPGEARKPKRRWRLYPFKGESSLPFIPVHRQSAYLFGRTRLIADIPIDHPSCSKQHAVLQFRLVSYKKDDDTVGKRIRPYIIDLESSNGTFVNNKRIDPRRYMELLEKDVVKFGFSTREYVMLHEESKKDSEDDDVVEEDPKSS